MHGPFGNMFPYTNFHEMNLDWVIQIARDFLDQYSHIQQIIEDGETSISDLTSSGLEQLQEKADALEDLLQAWYTEHSEDISNQLSGALEDLNAWYTLHEGYLDQTLTDNLEVFATRADAKAQETLENIPSDYTVLSNDVTNLLDAVRWLATYDEVGLAPNATNNNYWIDASGSGNSHSGYNIYRIPVTEGDILDMNLPASSSPTVWVFKSRSSGDAQYNVGTLHTEVGKILVTVPIAATYIFIALPQDATYTVKHWVFPKHILNIISGPIFMYISNSILKVVTGSQTRIGINGTYYTPTSWETEFEVPATSAWCIGVNSSGWYLKDPTLVDDQDLIVGWTYQNEVYTDEDNIITNDLPLNNLYQRENNITYFNSKKLRYNIEKTITKVQSMGDFFMVKNAYTVNEAVFSIIAKSGRVLTMPDGKMHQNSSNIANKQVLTIGDSITARGWYQAELQQLEPTLTFVGTRKCQNNSLMAEGYSGAKAEDVLYNSTITLPSGTIVPNPFWNPNTSSVDFAYYCSANDIVPNYVVIEFGLNETNPATYRAKVQAFIDQIKTYDSDIKVYVVQPFASANMPVQEGGQDTVASFQRYCHMCVLESDSFTDCVKIPCWYIMVDDYDYNSYSIPYGIGSVVVPGVSDAIHPSADVGFVKLGRQIYNYLGL